MFCDLTQSEWKEPNAHPGNTLTLSSLQQYSNLYASTSKKSDTKGVIMPPQLNVEPKRYIVPLLHLLIGLVNKAWSSMLLFFDKFVEKVSAREATIKDNIINCETYLAYVNEEIDIMKVNKNMAYLELSKMENEADRSCIESSIKEMKEQLDKFSDLK